ncbi:MAG: sensor histidine kinase, partial [Thermoguttaceae bacterium]
ECVFKDALNARRLDIAINLAIQRNRRSTDVAWNNCELQAAQNRIVCQAEQLQSYTAQLERINHELEEFAYIASHDLKEPLRGIGSYCEIFLEDYRHKLDCEGKRRLSAMMHLCDRLENLIDDLLADCRVGHKARIKTRVNLNLVAANLLKMLRPAIERRNARVRIAGTLPSIVGNASLIAMVLSNLTLNGLKFNRKSRPCVEIGCLPAKPTVFYVKDNGIGIGKQHHQDIFTIFRRLHSRKKYEGSGMGLTIVKKIVELHGGRIWLKSSPNAGTTFYFTLSPSENSQAVSESEHTLAPPHWDRRNRVSRLKATRKQPAQSTE